MNSIRGGADTLLRCVAKDTNMPWEYVACKLNYKGKCPGIILRKDLKTFLQTKKCRVPKRRTEVAEKGICWTCDNARKMV